MSRHNPMLFNGAIVSFASGDSGASGGISARERADEYRGRALECLQRAADASDRYERQSLLGLADAFNRLADHVAERRG